MLQTIRKVTVFVLFSILIGAFALSMGGTDYFSRYAQQNVATVGSISITPQQYQRAYQQAIENLSRRAGQRITPAQAQGIGLPNRVLQGLIQNAALDQSAQKLGLGLSQAGLRESILSNKAFQGADGKFSTEKYQQYLQRIGYSAPYFEQQLREELIRRQIEGVFLTSGVVPPPLLDAFNEYSNGQRTVSYFTIGAAAAGDIPPPAESVLQAFYDDHKGQFMAPEFRKVAVLAISPQTAASKVNVTGEDVKAEYQQRAANYAVPERRKLEIIAFQTKQAADSASEALKAGKSFEEVAKGTGFAAGDLDLGSVSKKEFESKFAANNEITDAAFSLDKAQVSTPINGPLSWVILKVDDITPGQEKSLDEVKDAIREDLMKSRSASESARLIKDFEQERSSGLQLSDIAKKLGLPVEDATIDGKGDGQDGKPVNLNSAAGATLAAAAFKSDIGVENEALRLPGGGYAWFEVQDIVKSRQKNFSEVKAEVEAAWRKEQLQAKLADKGRELVGRIDHGEAIADVAKSAGADVKTSAPLKREGSIEGMPASLVSQAFSLAEGGASSVLASDGAGRAIFQVTTVTPAPPLSEIQAKNLTESLSAEIANDNFAAYVSGVAKSAGVSVDRKNLSSVEGAAGDYED